MQSSNQICWLGKVSSYFMPQQPKAPVTVAGGVRTPLCVSSIYLYSARKGGEQDCSLCLESIVTMEAHSLWQACVSLPCVQEDSGCCLPLAQTQ